MKRFRPSKIKDAGFSLMELLVAIALFVLVAAITGTVITQANKATRRATSAALTQSQLLDVVSRMSREIAVSDPITEATDTSLETVTMRGGNTVQTRFWYAETDHENLIGEIRSQVATSPDTLPTDEITTGYQVIASNVNGFGDTSSEKLLTYYASDNAEMDATATTSERGKVARVKINLKATVQDRSKPLTLVTSMSTRLGKPAGWGPPPDVTGPPPTPPPPTPTPPPPPTPTPTPTLPPPVGPLAITLTGVASDTTNTLTWVSAGATYNLYRTDTVAPIYSGFAMTYADAGRAWGSTASYYAEAVNSVETKRSNTVVLITRPAPPVLSANPNPTLTNAMTWAASPGATSYTLYRCTLGANLALNKTVLLSGAGSVYGPRITDGNLDTAGYTSTGPGAASARVDLGSVMQVNTILTRRYYGDGRTFTSPKVEVSADNVTWNTVSTATYAETMAGRVMSFPPQSVRYIRDSTTGSSLNAYSHWVEIQAYNSYVGCTNVYSGAGLSFLDTGRAYGSLTPYHMVARNASLDKGGVSDSSRTVLPQQRPAAPVISASVPLDTNTVNLSWTGTASAISYRVELGGVVVYRGPARSFAATGRAWGGNYGYAVKAINGTGESAWSNVPIAKVGPGPFDVTFTMNNLPWYGQGALAAHISPKWTASAAATSYTTTRHTSSQKFGSGTWTRTYGANIRTDGTDTPSSFPAVQYLYTTTSKSANGVSREMKEYLQSPPHAPINGTYTVYYKTSAKQIYGVFAIDAKVDYGARSGTQYWDYQAPSKLKTSNAASYTFQTANTSMLRGHRNQSPMRSYKTNHTKSYNYYEFSKIIEFGGPQCLSGYNLMMTKKNTSFQPWSNAGAPKKGYYSPWGNTLQMWRNTGNTSATFVPCK